MATPPFAHGLTWYQTPNITARELAMLRFMADIIDEPDWGTRVFDTAYIESKRVNVLEQPKGIRQLLGTNAFEWCIKELQDKAREYTKSGLVHVYNTATTILKGDGRVSPELLASLSQDCMALSSQTRGWKLTEIKEKTIADCAVVDPTAYLLIWGRTRFLNEAMDGLEDCVDKMGTGQLSLVPPESSSDIPFGAALPTEWAASPLMTRASTKLKANFDSREPIQQQAWRSLIDSSWRGQRIPFDVKFSDQSSSTNVRIQSYVNSVYPQTNKRLYANLESLIEMSIGLWNQVLHYGEGYAQINSGVFPYRIKTWGVPWYAEKQSPFCCGPYFWGEDYGCRGDGTAEYSPEGSPEESPTVTRHWRHPDAGEAYSYESWKLGDTSRPVVPRVQWNDSSGQQPKSRGSTLIDDGHQFRSVCLQEQFRREGLQVLFQMTSIELNAKSSLVKGEEWHIEGLGNEHVCAVLLLPISIENIDPTYAISFRIPTNMDCSGLGGDTEDIFIMDEIFDTPSISNAMLEDLTPHMTQELGSVRLRAGQMLAWPNSVQSRLPDIHFQGENGHLQFLKIMLIDPHYRICSTSHIPPQQDLWWKSRVHELLTCIRVGSEKRSIPFEIASIILEFAISPGVSANQNALDMAAWQQFCLYKTRSSSGGSAVVEDRTVNREILPEPRNVVED